MLMCQSDSLGMSERNGAVKVTREIVGFMLMSLLCSQKPTPLHHLQCRTPLHLQCRTPAKNREAFPILSMLYLRKKRSFPLPCSAELSLGLLVPNHAESSGSLARGMVCNGSGGGWAGGEVVLTCWYPCWRLRQSKKTVQWHPACHLSQGCSHALLTLLPFDSRADRISRMQSLRSGVDWGRLRLSLRGGRGSQRHYSSREVSQTSSEDSIALDLLERSEQGEEDKEQAKDGAGERHVRWEEDVLEENERMMEREGIGTDIIPETPTPRSASPESSSVSSEQRRATTLQSEEASSEELRGREVLCFALATPCPALRQALVLPGCAAERLSGRAALGGGEGG